MNIRHYSPDDLEKVVGVFRSNIPKYFVPGEERGLREFLSELPGHYFTCELGFELVGAGGIALNQGRDETTVSLCWGMIRSDLLGKGLGRALTEYRIAAAREKYGPLPIIISTSQHTQGFYEKFGFRTTRYEADGFGSGLDICEMRLERTDLR